MSESDIAGEIIARNIAAERDQLGIVTAKPLFSTRQALKELDAFFDFLATHSTKFQGNALINANNAQERAMKPDGVRW